MKDDLNLLKEDGIDLVVSLLTAKDAQVLGVDGEAMCCAALDLSFINHPIVDFGVPDRESFRALVYTILATLQAGRHVVVHCRAGVGRSGTLAAAVLVALGHDPEDAMKKVSKALGITSPETEEQREFVRKLGVASTP